MADDNNHTKGPFPDMSRAPQRFPTLTELGEKLNALLERQGAIVLAEETDIQGDKLLEYSNLSGQIVRAEYWSEDGTLQTLQLYYWGKDGELEKTAIYDPVFAGTIENEDPNTYKASLVFRDPNGKLIRRKKP